MVRVLRETIRTPESVDRRLRLAGGINRYGEPNFRAVWGWSRLTWIGGKWEDRDRAGNLIREVVELRQVPKYVPFDRWHIERWVPPEVYGTPQQWYAQTIEVEGSRTIPALGPYPARGEYELCFTLEGPRGEFVPLTPTMAEAVARLIERSRGVPAWSRKAALFEREARAEREFDRWAYDVLDDPSTFARDGERKSNHAVPARHFSAGRGLPFISVPATVQGIGTSAPTSWVGKTGFSP